MHLGLLLDRKSAAVVVMLEGRRLSSSKGKEKALQLLGILVLKVLVLGVGGESRVQGRRGVVLKRNHVFECTEMGNSTQQIQGLL